jgi:hypothetical protein
VFIELYHEGDLMKAVIVQPFYLPWMGYFGMIDQADIFVFADNLQFVKKSWQRRNKIKTNTGNPQWVTIPVTGKYRQNINEIEINSSMKYKHKNGLLDWKENHWNLISNSYAKSPYFDDYKDGIKEILFSDCKMLSDFDIFAAKKVSELLGLNLPDFIKSSDMDNAKGKKVDFILNVCNELGADEYVSGPSAKNYIDFKGFQKFEQDNIELFWFEYSHPVYPQIGNEFLPYLSVIDLLFNTGEKAGEYIQNGLKNCLQKEDGCDLIKDGGNHNDQ